MKLSSFTGIARAIDPRYPTNRAIALLMLAAGLGGALVTGDGWQGLRAGLDVFFAWALCRELDPDHDLSAFLAVAFVLAGFAAGATSAGPLFWLLLVIRVVNRSTGLSATLVDSALVLYLGVAAGFGLFTALGFVLDALLAHGRKRQWVFAVAALIGSVGNPPQPTPSSLSGMLMAVILTALFLPVVSTSRRLSSVDDTSEQPLDPTRVRAAQVLALGIGLLGNLFAGSGSLLLLPLWSAVAAASLWRLGWLLDRIVRNRFAHG